MRIFLTLLLCALVNLSPAMAGQRYVVGMPCVDSPNCTAPEMEAVLREAYRRAGAEVAFAYLPRKRDLIEADSGIIDASHARIKSVLDKYTNLITVPTPLVADDLMAFTAKPGLRVTGVEDLKGLSVGIVRGEISAKELCEENGVTAYPVNSTRQAFIMLSKARLDAVLTTSVLGTLAAEGRGMKVYPSPSLHRNEYYHMLNRKHADFASRLAAVFKEMLKDGTTVRLLGKYAKMAPELPQQP